MKKIAYILFFVFLLSCQKKHNCNLIPSVLKSNDSLIITLNTDLSKYLKSIKENKLETMNYESYRLIINNSFSRASTVFKIEMQPDRYLYSSKIHQRKLEGIQNDSIINRKKHTITKKKWNELIKISNEINYWSLPILIEQDNHMKDGSTYIFEAFMPNKNKCTNRNYHFVVRYSGDTTKFKLLYEKLLEFDEQINYYKK